MKDIEKLLSMLQPTGYESKLKLYCKECIYDIKKYEHNNIEKEE